MFIFYDKEIKGHVFELILQFSNLHYTIYVLKGILVLISHSDTLNMIKNESEQNWSVVKKFLSLLFTFGIFVFNKILTAFQITPCFLICGLACE